jgi:hypothetical protein
MRVVIPVDVPVAAAVAAAAAPTTHPRPPTRRRPPRWLATAQAALLAAGLGAAGGAYAGPVPLDTYLQFAFDQPGTGAVGCDPADPAGLFCVPSSATPTTFLDAPAWTFSGAGFVLTVIDVFASGDRFDIFDFGAFVGTTSLPSRAPVDCGDDPVACLATAGMSTGVFALGAGDHALTLVANRSNGLGTGYLHIAALPEPASLTLALAALGLLCGLRQRRSNPTHPAFTTTPRSAA